MELGTGLHEVIRHTLRTINTLRTQVRCGGGILMYTIARTIWDVDFWSLTLTRF